MSENLDLIVKERAEKWLSDSYDEETRKKVKQLIDNDPKELTESFYKDLEFGTGGLRGIMGVGTNRMNVYTVGMATQGLSNYLKKAFPDEPIRVAVGHDSRNNSRLFAERVAAIFAANGFKVYLFDSLRPPPELSFAIRHLHCHSGVVVTASHNPKEYNGYKAYWSDGAQVVAPHDRNIIAEVENAENNSDELGLGGDDEEEAAEENPADLKAAMDELLDDPVKNYLKQIGQIPLLSAEQEVDLSKRIHAGAEAAHILQADRQKYGATEYIKKNSARFSFEEDENSRSYTEDIDEEGNEKSSEDAEEKAAEEEAMEAVENGPLTEERRQELLKIRRDGLNARRSLSEANLRLVVSIAKKHVGHNLAFFDLIQEGNIGLIKAAEKFDCDRGFRFSTYATWWIRQAITRAIADQARTIRIPVHMVETINKVKKVSSQLLHEYGHDPSAEEIAERLDMPVDKVREIMRVAQEPVSLETPIGEEEDSHLGDFIPDDDAPVPAEAASQTLLKEQLADVLKTLTPREEKVLRLRFGLEDGRPRTLEEVGKEFNVTRERIRQIEAKALRKLRHPSRSKKLRDFLD